VRGHPVDSTQLLYKMFDPVNGYIAGISATSEAERGRSGRRRRRRGRNLRPLREESFVRFDRSIPRKAMKSDDHSGTGR
jgi:hypothetical protein